VAETLTTQARRVLTEPGLATLLIDGIGPVGEQPDVALHDAGGHPGFCCEPGSTISRAAQVGAGAVLRVVDARTGDTVVFLGRLTPAAREVVDGQPVELVTLLTRQVLAEPGDALGQPGAPDELMRAAGTVLAHLNRDHGRQLRQLVGPASEVLFAELAQPRLDGVLLRWADRDGVRQRRLHFARPAADRHEYAALLRTALHERTDLDPGGPDARPQTGSGAR
jgi:hypothetical protein